WASAAVGRAAATVGAAGRDAARRASAPHGPRPARLRSACGGHPVGLTGAPSLPHCAMKPVQANYSYWPVIWPPLAAGRRPARPSGPHATPRLPARVDTETIARI